MDGGIMQTIFSIGRVVRAIKAISSLGYVVEGGWSKELKDSIDQWECHVHVGVNADVTFQIKNDQCIIFDLDWYEIL